MTKLLSEPLKGFDRFVRRMLKEWNVPGAAVGIVKNDRVIHTKGYGLRDVKRRLPVTENTLFSIASCTKAFTATTVAALVEEGKLEWDRPIKSYIPFFYTKNRFATERMNVRDILTHRTGLAPHDEVWYYSQLSREGMVKSLRHLEFSFDFRDRFSYNNLLYGLIGYLVERLTGKTWEECVCERILLPLEMNDTGFSTDDLSHREVAVGYLQRGSRNVPWADTFIEDINIREAQGPAVSAGAIFSTVNDMCRWLKLQLNCENVGGRSIFSCQALRETHTPRIAAPGFGWNGKELTDAFYGTGWFYQTYRGLKLVAYCDSFEGFNAVVAFLPDYKLGVVIMTNLVNVLDSPFRRIVMFNAFDRLLGLEILPWNQREKKNFEKLQAVSAKRKMNLKLKSDASSFLSSKAYTGEYRHPAYGVMTIYLKNNRLFAKHLIYTFELYPHQDNEFRMMWVRRSIRRRAVVLKIKFNVDKQKKVVSVSVQFDEKVGDIVFKRRYSE